MVYSLFLLGDCGAGQPWLVFVMTTVAEFLSQTDPASIVAAMLA